MHRQILRSTFAPAVFGFACALAAASAACGGAKTCPSIAAPSQVALESERARLMAADSAFAAATAQRGVEGWVSFFAEDGAQIIDKKGLVQGREAIRALMTKLFSNPDMRLEWQPYRADVSGDLGWTIGRARLMHREADGSWQVRAKLQYLTVWHRQPDGSWKVALDIGNEGPP